MRPPFVGHRRYSITHRAVQRLRELVPAREMEDDETIRDQLDEALAASQDGGRAIRTLDAMLGEPQTLIPVEGFGDDILYAIIKEETVVTVLPKGHGEEILQRGQAMEQRVAAGHLQVRPGERERFEPARRRWQKDGPPVVVQHLGRPTTELPAARPMAEPNVVYPPAAASVAQQSIPPQPAPNDPVASALGEALELGRRRAAVAALREALRAGNPEDSLAPLLHAMMQQGVPRTMTIGDLLDAARP